MKALHTFTDKVLTDRAQAGDIDAYEALFKRYSGKVYRFIFFRIKQAEIVDDLVNETFLRLWQQLNQDEAIKNVRAYIYKIARNIVIDHYRTRREEIDIATMEHTLEDATNLQEQVVLQSDLDELLSKMKTLRKDYQEVLQLRYVEDLSLTEISHILDKSKGAVKVMIHRAVKKLKTTYDESE